MKNKFKVGDKVIPINKSIARNLEESVAWGSSKKQGFMYVCSIPTNVKLYNVKSEELIYACDVNIRYPGDYFIESDLIKYEEIKSDSIMEDIFEILNDIEYKFESIFLNYDFTVKSDVNLAKFKGLVQKLKDIVDDNSK